MVFKVPLCLSQVYKVIHRKYCEQLKESNCSNSNFVDLYCMVYLRNDLQYTSWLYNEVFVLTGNADKFSHLTLLTPRTKSYSNSMV